jgi:hypothetical protein
MADAELFPFPSLDFPGRNSITSREVAEAVLCSLEHVGNLCRSGELEGKREGKTRNGYRITVADWRDFLLRRRVVPNPDKLRPQPASKPLKSKAGAASAIQPKGQGTASRPARPSPSPG